MNNFFTEFQKSGLVGIGAILGRDKAIKTVSTQTATNIFGQQSTSGPSFGDKVLIAAALTLIAMAVVKKAL